MVRPDPQIPDYLHLLTGHYNRGPEYRPWRQTGTDDWLLVATLSGRGRFGPAPKPLIVQAGDIVLIRPGVTHDYGTAPDAEHWELLWGHFHPRLHWHEWLGWPERTGGLMHLHLENPEWEDVCGCFREAYQYAAGVNAHRQNLAMNRLEEALLRCYGTLLNRRSKVDERVRSAIQHINSNLAKPMDVSLLADSVCLSPSRLAHLFREQIGMSPMHYVNLRRIERAKLLLERTTDSIKDVADEVGFSPIYFSLWFKQHTGQSPRGYRNRRVADPEREDPAK